MRELVARLYDEDLAGDDTLHAYHCRCDSCEWDSGYAFRAQSDSSCGGEVISTVFRHWTDEAQLPTEALQRAAVDTDAEPSWDAGFHVHVERPHRENDQHRLVIAFLQWEPVLRVIAAGSFQDIRGANASLRARLPTHLLDAAGESTPARSNTATSKALDLKDNGVNAFYVLSGLDRHTNLNVDTSTGRTVEYRLWNSTRAAWRMEMFCRLSVALATPAVFRALYDYPDFVEQADAQHIIDFSTIVCDEGGSNGGRAIELVERQLSYVARGEFPASYTL